LNGAFQKFFECFENPDVSFEVLWKMNKWAKLGEKRKVRMREILEK